MAISSSLHVEVKDDLRLIELAKAQHHLVTRRDVAACGLIAVTGLTNDDNGCNEPEKAIGDTTCGPGGGELQSNLRLVLTATGSTERPIAEDTVDEWAHRPAVDTRPLSGYEYRPTVWITYCRSTHPT